MTEETVLQTDRLLLRTWRDEDLNDLVWLHSRPDVSRYLSRSGKPWTRDEAMDRMTGWMRDFHQHGVAKLRLLRRDNEQFVGRAGFSCLPKQINSNWVIRSRRRSGDKATLPRSRAPSLGIFSGCKFASTSSHSHMSTMPRL